MDNVDYSSEESEVVCPVESIRHLDRLFDTAQQFMGSFASSALKGQVSLLHMNTVMGAPLNMVQLAYEQDPSQLTKKVLMDACKFGSPGVLSFLKDKFVCPEGTAWKTLFEEKEVGGLFQDVLQRHDEGAIMEYVDAFPQSLTNPSCFTNPLSCCLMRRGFSGNLLKFMASKMPDDVNFFNLFCRYSFGVDEGNTYGREELDDDCMDVLATVATKVRSFRSHSVPSGWWTEPTFPKLISIFFQRTVRVTKLDLFVPLLGQRATDLIDNMNVSFLKTDKVFCPIEELSVTFGRSGHNQPHPLLNVLSLAVHMPRLKSMIVSETTSHISHPCLFQGICEVLAVCKLQDLKVDANVDAKVDANARLEGDLGMLLDAVGTSQCLKVFSLVKYDNGIETTEKCRKHLLKFLENDNTLLETVEIGDNYPEKAAETETRKKTDYFAALNFFGRGKARDTTLAELVGLLSKVQDPNDFNPRLCRSFRTPEELFVANVYFGLLSEKPGMWSGSSCSMGKKRAHHKISK